MLVNILRKYENNPRIPHRQECPEQTYTQHQKCKTGYRMSLAESWNVSHDECI